MAIYAQWNGSRGVNQCSDAAGYIALPSGLNVSDPGDDSNYNSHGYYRVIVTQPTLSATETKDQEVWDFDGSTITLTWTVRNKTQDELDEETAHGVLDRQLYYVLKWLFNEGVITQTNVNNAPQALRDAWAARTRLEA